MNENARDYINGNSLQRNFTKNILDEIFENVLWEDDVIEYTTLDVGCGTGDVTTEILTPKLPKNFQKILGVDKSVKYIDYAKENYGLLDQRWQFDVIDVDEEFPPEYKGQFDLVTSFFCLHWLKDYKKAIQNMGKCLKEVGNIIIIFPGQSVYFDVLDKMAEMTKWKPFLFNVPNYISPLNKLHMKDTENECFSILENAGFNVIKCENRKLELFLDKNNFIAFLKPINPYESSIPDKLDEYYDDFLEEYKKKHLYDGEKYTVTFYIMVCHATKIYC